MEEDFRVIRSDRRTIGLEVDRTGRVVVRAPRFARDRDIERFVEAHRDWIRKQQEKARAQAARAGELKKLTWEELEALADRALKVVPERVRHYAPLVGVTYGRVTIRNQKTKWGSCSRQGNLNFNCLLMLAPPEVLDSVVVHELCHRLEMNHSERFYREVYRVFPAYDRWNRWLKENGGTLMLRMPE
ncbi:MAG: M48 family metallopeptidase [Lachnospiraceae bacterium]|nr:M48 family metallopeptidase [Lachnospiraceae bacterium]